ASRVHSLTFDETGGTVHGTWDIGSTPLVIDYTGPSPIAALGRALGSGFAGGNWNGTGLTSAIAAANTARNTGLGFAEARDVFGASGGVFDGVAVDDSAVLVRITLYGDANLDRTVNTIDFNLLAANFSLS